MNCVFLGLRRPAVLFERIVRRMRHATTSRPSISGLGLCLLVLTGGPAKIATAQSVAVSALALPQAANDIVWDSTRSMFFVSVGTNVEMINPETAQVVNTIPIGNQANQIAVSGDGQFLYASIDSADASFPSDGTINRYQIQNQSLDLQITLGQHTSGGILRDAQALVVLPGAPSSILVSTTDSQLMVFDGAVARAGTAALNVRSLYVRPSDGAIFGIGDGPGGFGNPQVSWLNISSNGVAAAQSVPLNQNWDNGTATWNGNLIAGRSPYTAFVFDLGAGATTGTLALPQSTPNNGACVLAADASGASAYAYQYHYQFEASVVTLVQYSLTNFLPTASIELTGIPTDESTLSNLCMSAVATWGTDGIAIVDNNTLSLYFLHASGLTALAPTPLPSPTTDASGVVHLPLPANGLIYDPQRNVLWASIPGNSGSAGNSVVSIDPGTGQVIDTIYAGSEPEALALSGDGSHLFATLGGAPAIASVDLSTKQSSTFSVLAPSQSIYWSAISVAAVSGQSNSAIAVLAGSGGQFGGEDSSVTAYDAGVPRTNTFENLGVTFSQYVQVIFPADAANAFYVVDTTVNYGGGTHNLFRLVVDSTGVRLDVQLNNVFLGTGAGAYGSVEQNQPVSMVYNNGRLFTSGAQMLSPNASQILASFGLSPAYGFPVPVAGQNEVVYVQSYSPNISANLYDLNTFRPLASVPLLTGPPCGCTTVSLSAVNVNAAAPAGRNAIAIAASGQIAIASLPNFQPWPSPTGSIQSVSAGIQQLNLVVNAISALPGSSDLLLATPSNDGSLGNSIVTLNPDTGQIVNSTFVGSEPSILSPAPDGSAVYAYLSGQYDVAKLNTGASSAALVFAADPSGGTNQYSLFDMAVGQDGGLAISISGTFAIGGVVTAIAQGGTIAVFDNGVPRPQADQNSRGPDANDPATFDLAFNDSGSILYAYNSFLSTFELKRDAVSPQGLTWLSTTSGLISGYGATIQYAQGFLYTSYGTVVDPERSLVVGQFADSWLQGVGDAVAPDPAGGRAYFATTSGILAFDINSHALLGRIPMSLGSNLVSPQALVRAGANSLALLTTAGQLYIVNISAIQLLSTPVPSPQLPFISPNGIVPNDSSVPIVQPGSWISIYGANLATSTTTWNNDFPTSLGGTTVTIDNNPAYLWYVSPGQINLQAPDDTTTGMVTVNVKTASGTASSSVTLSQFGPSLSLFDSQYVAAEILTPDGSGMYGGGTYDLVGPTGYFSFAARPVQPGETLVLYGVGFGPTNPPVPAGQTFTGAAPTTNPVTVTIGGESTTVLFSGLVAAGLFQINVVVPSISSGDQVVQAAVGGIYAPTAKVTVQ